jgi:hypothetical protein
VGNKVDSCRYSQNRRAHKGPVPVSPLRKQSLCRTAKIATAEDASQDIADQCLAHSGQSHTWWEWNVLCKIWREEDVVPVILTAGHEEPELK